MKKIYLKKMLAVFIVSTVITSMGAYQRTVYASPNETIEKALKSVKEQNLEKTLDTLKFSQIDPLIDTKSDEEIGVIVQLKGNVTKESKENIKNKQDKFKEFINKNNATKKNNKIKIKEEYSTVFNGMSLSMKANEVESLFESEEILAIWSDQQVFVDPIIGSSNDNLRIADRKEPSNVDSVTQIEADKLHVKNITGKGVKVGILDTGIDYNHPDLKDNYVGGYDCVDEDNDPMETTYDEWLASGEAEFKPTAYYTAHGTHVAGSIAGSGKSNLKHSVKGVAPEASIYAYRVLGPYGTGYFSDVIQGIELAVLNGLDVINLSLGSGENNPYTPTAQAVNNAMLKGTTVVIASGNAGSDVATVSAPGTASFPITVGASTSSLTKTTYDLKVGESKYSTISIADDFNGGLDKLDGNTYEMVFVDAGDQYDYDRLGITKEAVQGKVVVIKYGFGNIVRKLKLAKEYGAVAAIIYQGLWNPVGGIYESQNIIPAFKISKEDGEKIKENISSKISFTNKKIISDGSEELAYFSSRGPGYYEFDIKPDVVAPGVDVYSSVPVYITDRVNYNYDYAYGRMSGTSMATPHVTGAVALLKQANKKLSPFEIKEALMNTAEELDSKYGVNEIGSGRINVYDAVYNKLNIATDDATMVELEGEFVDIYGKTGALAFGKYSGDNGATVEKNIILTSNSNKDQTYDVAIEYFNNYPASNAEVNNVKLEGIGKTIKVNKKNPTTVKTKIVVPSGAEQGSYQGFITLTNQKDKEDTYRIPFSINYSKEGIKEIRHLREGISVKYQELFTSLLEAHLELGSHMTEISVFVQDPATSKILGISGSAEISGAPVNVPVRLGAFAGYVLPIDEQGNVKDEFILLPEGDYNIVYCFKDALGKEYIETVSTWVDNTSPELIFSEDTLPGVYEFDEIPESFKIQATSCDEGLKHVKEIKGDETYLDQSWSNVYVYEHNNFLNFDLIIPNQDGSFEADLQLDKDINKYAISAIDIFGAGSLRERSDFFIVKSGTPYIYTSFDKNRININDEVTMSVEMKNINEFNSGEFTVDYMDNYSIESIKLNDEFVNFAKEKGYVFELNSEDCEQIEGSVYKNKAVNISAVQSGEEPLKIDNEIKIFDVTLKAIDDFYYYSGTFEAFEECLIKNASINGENFENILNTNFIYQDAQVEMFY